VRCLELFAGAGGAALGLERSGMEHAVLVEWDADACATLRAAGLGPVYEGDVRDLDAIAEMCGDVDALWSSFPCQAFSSAGKRKGANDDRNGWPWTVAAVDRFRPRWFMGENVTGLLQHRGDCDGGNYGDGTEGDGCPGCYFHRVIRPALEERFPVVSFRVLDAAAYGVPQHRRRVFIVAGPRAIRWPEPTHGPPTTQRSMFGPGLLPYVTVRDALNLDAMICAGETGEGRPTAKRTATVTMYTVGMSVDQPSPCVIGHIGKVSPNGFGWMGFEARVLTDEPSTTIAAQNGGGAGSAGPFVETRAGIRGAAGPFIEIPEPHLRLKNPGSGDGEGARLDEPADAVSCFRAPEWMDARNVKTYTDAKGKKHRRVAHGSAVSRAATEPERLDRPSPCVSAVEGKGSNDSYRDPRERPKLNKASDAMWLATGRRRLTVEECATLCAFPDGYPFQGTKTSRYRQVGNCVVVPCAEAIGRAVLAADMGAS